MAGIVACGLLVFSVALDTIVSPGDGHSEFWWAHVSGFFSLFGLIGCVAIICVAKVLGTYWLQQKENYYESRNRHE